MRIVRRAFGDRPILHGVGDGACNGVVERRALVDSLAQRLIHFFGQKVFHDLVVKDVACKQFGNVHIFSYRTGLLSADFIII